MKKLLAVLGLAILVMGCAAQTVLVPKPLMGMPIDNTFHMTDWFYVMNQGTISNRISGATFMEAVSDSLITRWERTVDSLAALRADIQGGGSWYKTGHRMYQTDASDSVSIGSYGGAYKFNVWGTAGISSHLYALDLWLGPTSGRIYMSGGNMYLYDGTAGLVSLYTLKYGAPFTLTGTTNASTTVANNYNFGGTTATEYKVKVTGTQNVTGANYFDDYIYFKGAGGLYGAPHPRIGNSADTLVLADASGTYFLRDLVTGGSSSPTLSLTGVAKDPTGDTTLTKHNGIISYQKSLWTKSTRYLNSIADTIRFKNGSQIRYGTNSVELFPYNTGGRFVAAMDLNGKATLVTSQIEFNYNDTTYGAAGRMVHKADGYYYGYSDVLHRWVQFGGSGTGGGTGTVTTTGYPGSGMIATFSGASSVTGSSNFQYTGTTRSTGTFYSGYTDWPNANSSTMNYNGSFRSSAMYVGTATTDYTGVSESEINIDIGGATRTTINPKLLYTDNTQPYLFDTYYNRTGNQRLASFRVQGTEKMYINTDTSTFINALKYRGYLYSWKNRAETDTLGLVMYPGGKIDTASLVFASRAWEDKLEPFDKFYKTSSKLKSLPLPYPNGTIARKPNAAYMSYQFEYELERSTQYMKQLFDKNKELEAQLSEVKQQNVVLIKENDRKNVRKLRKQVDDMQAKLDWLMKNAQTKPTAEDMKKPL